ncbi:MAG: hypothetical protein EOP36_07110 [Rubrivivax sp.]|nr:MAG: hypothetical protein EOP36_07110 [Rubrivivax sp.]
MAQLLMACFFLAVLLLAPLKASAIFLGALLLATLVVQATTATMSQVRVTMGSAFKAIVLSLFFSAIATFTAISFVYGAPRFLINNLSGMALVGLQYGAYILGFRMALGLTTLHAAMVAVASTLITSASIWFIAKMMPAA